MCGLRSNHLGGNGTCPMPVFVRERLEKLEVHECSRFHPQKLRDKTRGRHVVHQDQGALFS